MKAVKNVSLGIKILFWQRRLSNCWVGELFDCEMLEIPIFQTKVDIYIHLSRLTGRLIKLQTQIRAWLVRTRMVKQKQHFSILRISPDRKNSKRIITETEAHSPHIYNLYASKVTKGSSRLCRYLEVMIWNYLEGFIFLRLFSAGFD